MKKLIIMTGIVLLTAGLGKAVAQENVVVGGRVINAPLVDAGRMLLFSQNDMIYGTSRTVAMGGAFTSLGADLSSMNINPAGLGMYQSSDFGITQALSVNKMNTSINLLPPSGTFSSEGTRTSYGLNNFGAAFNVYQGSGNFTSLTLGITYNRAANFNSRTRLRTTGELMSISGMYARQLDYMIDTDAHPDYLREEAYWDELGAVFGYESGIVGHDALGFYANVGDGPFSSEFSSVTRGGIYEYDFSAGANISNIVYFGATINVMQIDYRDRTTYTEYYPGISWQKMVFDQSTNISGAGVSAKFGVVVRPVEALRIGAAIHLPTWYSLQGNYEAEMRADSRSSIIESYEDHFSTGPRLLVGASGIIADRAILALDWEAAWYNRIQLRENSAEKMAGSKAESKRLYKPAHTLRFGFEYLVSDVVSARAGAGYMFDFMKPGIDGGKAVTNYPTAKSGYTLSAGVGFNVGRRSYIDLAYLYNRARMTPYDLYYFERGGKFTAQYTPDGSRDIPRDYTPRKDMHQITLTLGCRF